MKRFAFLAAVCSAATLFADFTGHGGLTPNTNADRRLEELRRDITVHRYDVR